MVEEKTTEIDLAELIKSIDETIKRIDKSLEKMAGSIDSHDGVFCIKGEVTTTNDY